MLDNLRNQATFNPGDEEPPEINPSKRPKQIKPRRSFDQMTGTTDKQRFMLAVMLLVIVCLLGVVTLVFTGKVLLPVSF